MSTTKGSTHRAGRASALIVGTCLSLLALPAPAALAEGVNAPPVTVADTAKVVSGGQVRVDVLANDSDPDGDALTLLSAAVTAGGGSAAVDGSAVVVTAEKGFVGSIVVDYQVADPNGGTATGTLTVTVSAPAPTNHRPVARGDAVTVQAGRTTRIAVLANDSDPDSDKITLVKVTKAAHGSATVAGSKVVYRAPSSYSGTVRVTYTIKDSHGSRDTARVTITVKRKPTPPSTTPTRRQVEAALARLALPVGSVNGSYDSRTRRALCAWRVVTGRTVDRDLPSRAEAKAIVATRGLPGARPSMVTGVNVSVTCQAAFWVRSDRSYRRIMAATTGKPGFRTRTGTYRISRTYHTWKWSTLYPEARMYKPMFFSGGQALHGSSTDALVKTYPASHGCVRMLHRDINAMQAGGVGNGTRVRVWGSWRG